MASLGNKFIDEIFRHLSRNDAISLGTLLKIKNPQYKKVFFNEDSMKYLTERFKTSTNEIYTWSEVISYYILTRNSLMNNDYADSFDLLTKSFKCLIDLIKDAKDENWQLPVLFTLSVDLRLLAYTCDTKKQNGQLFSKTNSLTSKDTNGEFGGNQSDEYAEKTAECLMICFRNLCTDTRSDSQVSKRWGMMVSFEHTCKFILYY